MRFVFPTLFAILCLGAHLPAQQPAPATDSGATLRINSRAVLVDLLVTDSKGNPVTGLKQGVFTLTEKGKTQTISYFEEHRAGESAQPAAQPPKLPQNVFTNYSPTPPAPVVTVLLLDALNTHLENQSFVHAQALKFLKSAKPGSRMAIFGMGLRLQYIQGFSDDPALLAKALDDRNQSGVQTSAMLRGEEDSKQSNLLGMMSSQTVSGGMGTSAGALGEISRFFQQNDDSRTVDRTLLTLENLQRLATFLNGFPGRKDVIWFSEAFPLRIGDAVDLNIHKAIDGRVERMVAKTVNTLTSARVALYPVDASGGVPQDFFEMGHEASANHPAGTMSVEDAGMADQGHALNVLAMRALAEETGGRAYSNNSGLAQILSDIEGYAASFYTLSYSPTNTKLDGSYRKIEVKFQGGEKYRLSYRRGYYAVDDGLPGSVDQARDKPTQAAAANGSGAADLLLPSMDLGMPQSQQIVFAARINPVSVGDKTQLGDPKSPAARYVVELAVNTKDLQWTAQPDGTRTGAVSVSLIAYDGDGKAVSGRSETVQMNVRPEKWTFYQTTGVPLRLDIAVPKGRFCLRAGIVDQGSRNVGTLEIPLALVQTAQAVGGAK